jgi:1-acyl-sn-glycerol-3-phosphate acyltransferase
LYQLFKFGAQLAMKIYCSKTVVNFDCATDYSSAKIIACNHPNSFFDAIVIAVNYPKPIYFLARGDAFKKPLVAAFLNSLQLIPIYRLSEGKSNLVKNEDTFKRCLSLLKNKETILIFSEGICVNEWQLRPLKKGTARLALMASTENKAVVKIQPTNINYSSFDKNPKQVVLNFNAEFELEESTTKSDADFYNAFNSKLQAGMIKNLVIQSEKKQIKLIQTTNSNAYKIVLAIPALIGFILNYTIYCLFKKTALQKTKNTVFYDSVLFGLLFLCYPVIITLIALLTGLFFDFKIGVLVMILFPLSAWCYSQYKSMQVI